MDNMLRRVLGDKKSQTEGTSGQAAASPKVPVSSRYSRPVSFDPLLILSRKILWVCIYCMSLQMAILWSSKYCLVTSANDS